MNPNKDEITEQIMDNVILSITQSVCPVCGERIRAENVMRGGKVYIEKTCGEHGFFSTLIWNSGGPDYVSWDTSRGTSFEPAEPVKNAKPSEEGCPYDCGICENHVTGTCCVLLEVTKRCNLRCPVCYADAGNGSDVPLSKIEGMYDMLLESGRFNIQLSGGEPSVRDDLPEIIEMGRKKGFTFFQLNTNGIRIAQDMDYLKRLKDAGLSCVFLQFDSLRDEANLALRGRKLADVKLRAVENAGKAGLGVVLVPTVVKGVNDRDVGRILGFAVKNMPVVRGVHFQPVSFFGRYNPDFTADGRITLPDMLRLIETQTNGKMKASDFAGGNTESAYCSFHGSFIYEKGSLRSKGAPKSSCCCSPPEKARDYVARRWSAAPEEDANAAPDSMDGFLVRYARGTLAVSGMLFQDAWTVDLDRLRKCYIHVVSDKGLTPFCVHNLTIGNRA